ncbi:MAG: NAD(P)-binding domain-containing protein [Microcoleus sp.]
MKIGIIGAGNVGRTLGRILTQKGHSIVFGVTDPQSAKMQSAVAST